MIPYAKDRLALSPIWHHGCLLSMHLQITSSSNQLCRDSVAPSIMNGEEAFWIKTVDYTRSSLE